MAKTLIRNALREKGISQKALAAQLGCSEGLVSLLIKGEVHPTYRRAQALHDLLGIPVDRLMDETNAATEIESDPPAPGQVAA